MHPKHCQLYMGLVSFIFLKFNFIKKEVQRSSSEGDLSVDLKKAFDMLKWDVIFEKLKAMRFRKMIENCINLASFCAIVEG